jgi:hypothetical protein
MTSKTPYRAPSNLAADTRAWVEAVVDDYELEPHHLRLLQLAGEAWDRGQEARAALRKHGAVYVDRFGQPTARP